jgi:hypothetical protein
VKKKNVNNTFSHCLRKTLFQRSYGTSRDLSYTGTLVAGTFREGRLVWNVWFLCVCGDGGYIKYGLLSIIQSLMCMLVRTRAVCSNIVLFLGLYVTININNAEL